MRLKHVNVYLELHSLREGPGLPLLLLHELRGSTADWKSLPAWNGPVYGLDFSGHGASDWVRGGAYYPELMAADADTALAHVGRAALVGAGLGAYVALMLAGARPADVAGALLLPGAGLEGGGSFPDYEAEFPDVDTLRPVGSDGCDPMVDLTDHFVRPEAYAFELAATASRILLAEDGSARPPWWVAIRGSRCTEIVGADLGIALARLSSSTAG
jgi:pimeloyl-ACP methyl ester carboxylesterase